MKKYINRYSFSLLIPIAVIGIFIAVLTVLFFAPKMKENDINSSANETTKATIVEIYSNTKIDGHPVYNIVYQWNFNGEIIKSTSVNQFNITVTNQIIQQNKDKTLMVKYNSKGESLIVGFKSYSANSFIIVGIIISVIEIIVIFFFLKSIVSGIHMDSIAKYGKSDTGKVTSYYSKLSVNGKHLYKIEFTFNNGIQRYARMKTGSIYSFNEAKYYSRLVNVDIRYSGKKAVIVEEYDESSEKCKSGLNENIELWIIPDFDSDSIIKLYREIKNEMSKEPNYDSKMNLLSEYKDTLSHSVYSQLLNELNMQYEKNTDTINFNW